MPVAEPLSSVGAATPDLSAIGKEPGSVAVSPIELSESAADYCVPKSPKVRSVSL